MSLYDDPQNLAYINGFDHPDIIAGAGTMGIEILNQVPNVDAIVVPVGGGGLIAGIALAVKTLAPNVKVIVSCTVIVLSLESLNSNILTKL